MKALVVTPTTGSSPLGDAVESVLRQTYADVRHLIVVDGINFSEATNRILSQFSEADRSRIDLLQLPYNTGAQGHYGHRIYAGISHFVNAEVLFLLDQDNWYQPQHVEFLMQTIESKNLDWAFSLRNVYDKKKNFVTEDNCESLGRWPIWCFEEPRYLVDTSCFAIKRSMMLNAGHIWHQGWGGDRIFLRAVSEHYPKFACSGKYTMNYRLDGNPNSVNADFFLKGNQMMTQKYGESFPWREI